MYSLLVTVLLLASAANSSGGQGAMGGGVGEGWGKCLIPLPTAASGGQGARGGGVGGEVYQLVSLYSFAPQVHKCPSQATHVHNLTYQALMIRDGAQSVVDFGLVR